MASRSNHTEAIGRRRLLLYGTAAAFLLVAPPLMPDGFWLKITSMTGIYVMLALGLNVVAGFAGLLDMAYVAFFGIGGYLFALLSSSHFGIHAPFLVALPVSAFGTMGVGFALGSTSMRLKREFLAIVTLVFAQIFMLLLVNLDRPLNITGGVTGIYDLDPVRFFGFTLNSPLGYTYLIWTAAAIVAIGCFRLKRSRYGRGWAAIREDELAAEVLGVNTSMMKLTAFAAGAFIAGAAGALFASFQNSVFPDNFDFPQLVIVYSMVVLGGLGNVAGVILGAVLLSILPELLPEWGGYRLMLYGLILIVLMALRPQGITGSFLSRTRKRPDKDPPDVLRTSSDLCYPGKQHERIRRTRHAKGEKVVLEVQRVTRNFGGILAVDEVSFQLHEKEVLSIIGPNGAGKTTLFNLITGIYNPTSGTILYQGKRISGLRPHRIVRAGIGRTFQNTRLFNSLTVLDNTKVAQFCRTNAGPLSIVLHLPRFKKEEDRTERRAKEALDRFGARLTGRHCHREARTLSCADRRFLEIARAVATGATLLMLDEPSAGMSPRETEEVASLIKRLRDDYGYTIIVIEHKISLVRSISDRVIALGCGRKIAEGTYEEVAEDPGVVEAYLGRKRP